VSDMTPDDLAAIRARDADTYRPTSGRVKSQAQRDRRTLLAEVDRLEAEIVNWRHADVRQGTGVERARIHAGVEGLPSAMQSDPMERVVNRAAVLRVVEGEG
jgi:hypothetical protein